MSTSFATLRTAFAALLVVVLSGCGDDPFQQRWFSNTRTASLYSLSRPELNLPSAFGLYDGQSYRVEVAGSTGRWDLAFDLIGGAPVLLPPGALGVTGEARIIPLPGENFDTIERAPADLELYSSSQPVPVQLGQLYVVRTNQQIGPFGTRCTYFGKLVVDELDLARARLTFRYDVNPICNSRRLQPDR